MIFNKIFKKEKESSYKLTIDLYGEELVRKLREISEEEETPINLFVTNILKDYVKEYNNIFNQLRREKIRNRICLVCNKPFEKHHQSQKYCSRGCRDEANRRRSRKKYYEKKGRDKQ